MAERKYGRKARCKSFNSRGECTNKANISDKAEDIVSMADFETDPFGSYTGVPVNPGETPVQDADDL